MILNTENRAPIAKEMYGIKGAHFFCNLPPALLIQQTLDLGQGTLSSSGALVVSTGRFTGRSPKDRFIVKDDITSDTVDWGDINRPFDPDKFNALYHKVCHYLEGKTLWFRNGHACAAPDHQVKLAIINEQPWGNLFCHNLFLREGKADLENAEASWLVLQAPGFKAEPTIDATRQANFTIINFTRKIILIGGSAYTGEMKKGIFSVLNFTLPKRDVLPMHCSANEGKEKDVALFFGLSGTGKTTLSADPDRPLIGDDEHGWAEGSVFNFEGGCYAKVIDLDEEKEPQIFAAVKPGALLENVVFHEGKDVVDYSNASITENTRVSYPIDFIQNAKPISYGGDPKNIFFLTCDAMGVLPPISKLSVNQAMYYFLSGYTAKVAGTEVGVIAPQTTFSACFGRVFLPLSPAAYALLLGKKLSQHPDVNVWLVNTGWSGGEFGVGQRIRLKYTRAMIKAALDGDLNKVDYEEIPVFNLAVPTACPNVDESLLNPRNTWQDEQAYDAQCHRLAARFVENFQQFSEDVDNSILMASPVL